MRRRFLAERDSNRELPIVVASMDRPADPYRAYLVRGIDLQWQAKRAYDGEIIYQAEDRGEVRNEATRRGYHFTY